jgi:hypothetical protein
VRGIQGGDGSNDVGMLGSCAAPRVDGVVGLCALRQSCGHPLKMSMNSCRTGFLDSSAIAKWNFCADAAYRPVGNHSIPASAMRSASLGR